jgi:hypothetical protein
MVMHNLMVGKGGLPPLVECHSIKAGASHLPDPELFFLESFSIAMSFPALSYGFLSHFLLLSASAVIPKCDAISS